MHLGLVQEARLEQTLSPRMIQFYEMLQCPLQELDHLITRELEQNPALELVERPLSDPLPDGDHPAEVSDAPPPPGWAEVWSGIEEVDDPVAALPAPVSLRDHLQWHFMALARSSDEQRIGRRIIAEIDPDGYFHGHIGEVAMVLQAGVVTVERVLELVQRLDPVGVGARDLRECLQIQLRWLREQGQDHVVAWRVTEECWEPFARRQFAVCARKLKVSEAAVSSAADFIRANCQPYPGREFRPPWQAAGATPQASPEVYIRYNPAEPPEFLAEVIESQRLALRIDRVYRQLYDELQAGRQADTEDARHVQSCVRRARQFIRSVEQRRQTVRHVAELVANQQAEFVRSGPTHIKPLTRLEVARQLGLHESTVGRAVAGKWVGLPSDEVVPFERFFDSAQPVKAALERLLAEEDPARPLSDDALAKRLAAEGYDIARRTVTKYRLEMKVPPASQRKR